MKIITVADGPDYDPEHLVAVEVLAGSQANVRMIRLSPGQVLPAHKHEPSDLVLYAVEGEGTIVGPDGPVRFGAGALAQLDGHEELRLSNDSDSGLTLLAFLAPPFPPAASR